MTIQFNLFRKEINTHSVEFLPVSGLVTTNFNIMNSKLVFSNMPEREFGVSESASITIRNLTGYIVYPDEGSNETKHKLVYATSYKEVKNWIVNNDIEHVARIFQQSIDKNDEIVVSVFDNNIVGVFRNYIGVEHDMIMEVIKMGGISNRFIRGNISETGMNVYMSVKDKEVEVPYDISLRIYNNIDSSKGLGYSLWLCFGETEFDVSFSADSKRHLSKVAQIFEGINTAIETIQEFNVPTTLANITSSEAISMLYEIANASNPKHMEFINKVDKPMGMKNAADVFISINQVSKERGFKMVAKELGEKLINHIFNI